MVIGHKNPDTDSICSAIAYAHFKQAVLGTPAVPYRAGNLNPQTGFVLNRFGVPQPELITSMLPRISDIMIKGEDLLVLAEHDSLGKAQAIMTQRRFAFLPVRNTEGKFIGKVSTLRLAGLSQDIGQLACKERLGLRLPYFLERVGGNVICGVLPPVFEGKLWFQGLSDAPAARPLLAVLPRPTETALRHALDIGASVIIVCATSELVLPQTVKPSACILTTKCDLLEVATHICLALPLRDFVDLEHPTLKPHDLVREARQRIRQYNEGGFIVVDDDGSVCGVMTRVTFLSQWRFRVALVDHNELSQSVDGIEEANVEEVIDHHRLGYRTTDQPITFINKVVGCTATIIGELYRNVRQAPPPPIAGLMLAAILSDTVILQSPTTTALDREMAEWLAGLAGVDVEAFGREMFAAGCALEELQPAQIIGQDLKVYQESGWKFSVSQMETVGFDAFKRIRDAMATALDQARAAADCRFSCLMVTDITRSTSLLLCTGDSNFIDAITYPKVGDNLFEMHGVLSRKKQMMPYLTDVIRRLTGE